MMKSAEPEFLVPISRAPQALCDGLADRRLSRLDIRFVQDLRMAPEWTAEPLSAEDPPADRFFVPSL